MLSTVPNNGFVPNARSALPVDSGTVGVLVKAAQRGEVKAFEQLYRLHSGRVLGLCLRMTRERDTAEDCVQQTFIKAWRNLAGFELRSSFATWLHGIAVNVVLTHRRGNRPMQSLDELEESDPQKLNELGAGDRSFGDSRQFDMGDIMDLERVLATLPDGARDVIVLQAVYGYSHEEVAGMLGIAVGTCKAQLHRARRMLRFRLGESESSDE